MKHVTEYRDAELVGAAICEIGRTVTKPWVIICLLYTSPSPRD